MNQAVAAVGISLTTIVTAEIKDFRLGKKFYNLTIERLSVKMSILRVV